VKDIGYYLAGVGMGRVKAGKSKKDREDELAEYM